MVAYVLEMGKVEDWLKGPNKVRAPAEAEGCSEGGVDYYLYHTFGKSRLMDKITEIIFMNN